MRATSTVVDAAICLVLVTVAVTTLTAPAPAPADTTSDDIAETLASTTTSVGYVYGPADGEPTVRRTATGTHAGLLGRAAVSNLTLDGEALTSGSEGFQREIRNTTTEVLDWNDHRTRIEVRWEPYPGAPLGGTVTVGPAPPPAVDASVTTLSAPVPIAAVDEAAVDRRGGGYRAVADAIADPVVSATLPDDGIEFGSAGSAARHVATQRYRMFADATDTSVNGPLDSGDPSIATDRIGDALADRLAADLRQRFDSPEAAVDALRTGHASIVVMEWES